MSKEIWSSPISIGKASLKNRIVFPPISPNWADEKGCVTGRLLKFYKELAEGGCGMIVVEGTAISPEGKGITNSLCLYSKEHIQGLTSLSGAIIKNGCFASIQLVHAGGQANPNFTGYEPVSPSDLRCKATGFSSRKLSFEEISEIKDKFISSAELAWRVGFHAVELHLAHGYLLHQFLSEYTNKRDDDYGGSLKNRVRLVLEIISGIKKRVPHLIIGARVSGEDYLDNGINYMANKLILPILQEKGIEYLSVSAGIYDTSNLKHLAMKRGEFFKYARYVKEIVDMPVIGCGKILDIESAEDHLRNNDCDLVAIGRGLIADPMMIKKTMANQHFNRCTECGQCQYLRLGKNSLSCPLRQFN